MLSQQIIIEMTDRYPFGIYERQDLPEGKIYVRRLIQYNESNYQSLKEKFDVAKKISNPNVIKLEKVLEEQGRFHLLYEYVPFAVSSLLSNFDTNSLENMKFKLVFLSAYLYENKMETEFIRENLGFDKKHDLKYYLDINFRCIPVKHLELRESYIRQINTIFSNLSAERQKDERKIKVGVDPSQISEPPSPSIYSRRATIRHAQPPKKDIDLISNATQRQASVTSKKSRQLVQTPKPSSLKTQQMLNHIEMKLGELKITIKGGNHIEHKQLRDSVKQKYANKDKFQNRKYSGDINYFSPIVNKKVIVEESPKSVRRITKHKKSVRLENINQASEQQNNRKESTQSIRLKLQITKQVTQRGKTLTSAPVSNTNPSSPTTPKNFDTISRSSKLKQPRSKGDFEQIKKSEYENFYKCKQVYVHEFIGVLGDEGQKSNQEPPATQPTTVTSTIASNRPKYQLVDKPQDQPVAQNISSRGRNLIIRSQPSEMLSPQYEVRRKNIRQATAQRGPLNTSEQRGKDGKDSLLKDRITKAIKQSSIALQRYRKISVHSIKTEFNMSRKSKINS